VLYIANLLLTYAVLAMGLDILLGRAGQFAFAHVAFYGIGIYTTALITNDFGLPFFVGMAAGALLAAAVAIVIALPATRLRDVYLALATFAFAEAAQWVFNNWDSVTKGPNGLRIKPADLFGFTITNDRDAFFAVLAVALVTVVATVLIARSSLGRNMRAIRESEHVALASGIDVRRVKIVAFAISGAYAGIAGGMFTLFQSFIHPDTLGFETIVLILTMVVVGGLGTIPGVLLGVLLLGLLPEALRDLRQYQELVYGLILIAAVVFMPRGVWGLVTDLVGRRKPRTAPRPISSPETGA
jgi:branched-chain amino acid transport system permease protein